MVDPDLMNPDPKHCLLVRGFFPIMRFFTEFLSTYEYIASLTGKQSWAYSDGRGR
jgi:hypothetical protein